MTPDHRAEKLRACLQIAKDHIDLALGKINNWAEINAEDMAHPDLGELAAHVNLAHSFMTTCYRHAYELAEADVLKDRGDHAMMDEHSSRMASAGIQAAAAQHERPSVMYRPRLFLDGDQYCALYGDDIMSGCAGFGDTAAEAMADFDTNWRNQNAPRREVMTDKPLYFAEDSTIWKRGVETKNDDGTTTIGLIEPVAKMHPLFGDEQAKVVTELMVELMNAGHAALKAAEPDGDDG